MKKLICVLMSILCLVSMMQFAGAESLPVAESNENMEVVVARASCSHPILQLYGPIYFRFVYKSATHHQYVVARDITCITCDQFIRKAIVSTEDRPHTWSLIKSNCLGIKHEYAKKCSSCGAITTWSEVCGGLHNVN